MTNSPADPSPAAPEPATNLPPIRIATRASQLALWQANYVADLIRQAAPGRTVELVRVTTSGDSNQVDPLRQFGGLGLFTREVQAAVLRQDADLAVHSLKDLPTESAPGLTLAAVPPRANRFDVLVLPPGQTANVDPVAALQALPPNARIGTGSPRRQAQLLRCRPDLKPEECRGNVDTRLRKLRDGEFAALILAAAGLTRLGLAEHIAVSLTPPVMFPAVGQGAIGIECRADDVPLRELLHQLTDPSTFAEVQAERSLLATLRAGCHAPLGVKTTVIEDTLHLEAVVLTLTGTEQWQAAGSGPLADPIALGQQVAEQLLALGVSRALHASDADSTATNTDAGQTDSGPAAIASPPA